MYDNEKWAYPVDVDPFAIARAAVTQAEFAAFVDAGGYADTRLWSDGGQWLSRTVRQPHAADGSWQRRHFDTWLDLEPDLAVSHVSGGGGRLLPMGRATPADLRPSGSTPPAPARFRNRCTRGATNSRT